VGFQMDMFGPKAAVVNDQGLRVHGKNVFAEPEKYPLATDPSLSIQTPEIEAWLVAEANELLAKYEADPTITTTLSHNSRVWRAISALQKAVRRGDALVAKRCAHALLYWEPSRLFWRLPVICYEDIGLADPYVVATVATLLKSKYKRNVTDTRKLVFWLIDLMCAANKSRSFCDVVVSAHYSPRMVGKFKDKVGDKGAIALALDPEEEPGVRVVALWSLYGTRTSKNEQLGTVETDWPAFHACVSAFNLPPLLKMIFTEGLKNRIESLPLGLPVTYDLIMRSKSMEIAPWSYEVIPTPVVAGLPSYAYDWHNLEGKRSIGAWPTRSEKLKEWFAVNHPKGDAMYCCGMALFEIESGLLRNEFRFDGWEEMYRGSMQSVADSCGFSYEQFMDLKKVCAEEISVLNKSRGFFAQ
jgi:hypothetical protein